MFRFSVVVMLVVVCADYCVCVWGALLCYVCVLWWLCCCSFLLRLDIVFVSDVLMLLFLGHVWLSLLVDIPVLLGLWVWCLC